MEFDNGVSATRGYVEGNPFALVIHSTPRISKPDAGGIRRVGGVTRIGATVAKHGVTRLAWPAVANNSPEAGAVSDSS